MKFLTGLVLALILTAGAGAQAMDAGLKKLMDQSGLKYSTTKSGNAAVTYTLDDDRSQTVYITTKTVKVGNLELREVWSNAGYLSEDEEAATYIEFLTEGGQENIGGWNFEEDEGQYLAYYSTRIPELTAENLKSVLEYIATVADAKEAALSDEDEN